MNIDAVLRPVRNEAEYRAALAELDRRMNLVDAAPSLDPDHTEVLAILIEHWERAHFEIDPPRLRCRVWHYPQDDEYEGLMAFGHLGRQMFRAETEKYLNTVDLDDEDLAALRSDLARGEPEHVWARWYLRGDGPPERPVHPLLPPPEGYVCDLSGRWFFPVASFHRYEDADEGMGFTLCERSDLCAEPYTLWRVPDERPHPARDAPTSPSGRGEDSEGDG